MNKLDRDKIEECISQIDTANILRDAIRATRKPGDLLDQLSELYAQRDLLQLDLNAKRAEIMASVQGQLDALDMEYTPKLSTVSEKIEQTETEVKAEALTAGETQRGQFLMVVWSKGRETWDTKALTGYAAAHPELAQFKRVGEPSVSIRKL